jgi:predicted alpha/beta hydrolase family esterase
MPASGARQFLILHGWGGSGPDHWQSWLASQLRAAGEAVRFPTLPNPDEPRLEEWLTGMRHELSSMTGSRIVVCHSLAVLLWLHHTRQPDAAAVDRLLLVAPPGPAVNNPQVETFFPAPRDPLALHQTAREIELVCSVADPFCPERAEHYYGEPLGVQTLLYPSEAGHINVASGYGPWPWVESWCRSSTHIR